MESGVLEWGSVEGRMTMQFQLNVTVERAEGKFAPRDEIAEALEDGVYQISLDGLGADGSSVYQIEGVEVVEDDQ